MPISVCALKKHFLCHWCCGKKTNWMWFSTVSTDLPTITLVKICRGLTWLHLMSPQHLDHCDDALLSIRVKTMLNHIQFLNLIITYELVDAWPILLSTNCWLSVDQLSTKNWLRCRWNINQMRVSITIRCWCMCNRQSNKIELTQKYLNQTKSNFWFLNSWFL